MRCSKNAALFALAAALACGMGAGSASAQGSAVNTCTLLTDPTLLRECVERVRQGGNPGASPSSSQDAYSPHRAGAGDGGALRPGSRAAKADGRRAKSGKRGGDGDTGAVQPRDGRIP